MNYRTKSTEVIAYRWYYPGEENLTIFYGGKSPIRLHGTAGDTITQWSIRRTGNSEQSPDCQQCGQKMMFHGFIDYPYFKGGSKKTYPPSRSLLSSLKRYDTNIVCPGDWVVCWLDEKKYAVYQPDKFRETFELLPWWKWKRIYNWIKNKVAWLKPLN